MRLIAAIVFGLWCSTGFSLQIPALTDPVMDLARVLTPAEAEALSHRIRQIHNDGKGQLQILTLASLDGEPIEEVSIRVAEAWKLGLKKKGNGLLITLAIADRAIRIEVGEGLEGDIPDVLAGRIIEGMKPFLRQQQYGSALGHAVDRIAALLYHDGSVPVAGALPGDELDVATEFPGWIIGGVIALVILLVVSAFSFLPRLILGGVAFAAGGSFVGLSALMLLMVIGIGCLLLATFGELLYRSGFSGALLRAFLRGGGNGRWGGGSSRGGGSWGGGGGGFSGGGSSGKW